MRGDYNLPVQQGTFAGVGVAFEAGHDLSADPLRTVGLLIYKPRREGSLMARRRIDVHQHFLPPAYSAWLRSLGIDAAGGRDLPDWSASAAVEIMHANEMESAVLSVSTPGVCPADADRARGLARELNEFGADLARSQPSRFGYFATLPMPDVEAATAEACFALDHLDASGVILLANANGRYLGCPEDEELFAELDRRSAVVFVHPSSLPASPVEGVPPFAADFLLDTTRAAFRLVRNGFVRRYANLKIVLAHAGGFVPYASHRLAAAIFAETGTPPDAVLDDLASFYFDTALSSSPAALPSLLAFAKPGHILFGSDWPFAPDLAVAYFAAMLDAFEGADAAMRAAIDRGNAEILFPRFRQ